MYKQIFEHLCLMMSSLVIPIKVELLFPESGSDHRTCCLVVDGLSISSYHLGHGDSTEEEAYKFVVNSIMMGWVEMRMKMDGVDIFKKYT
jgi:hypothetical protein